MVCEVSDIIHAACINALMEFCRIQPDMPVSRMLTFLAVAQEEGLGVREYGRATGTPPTTMTRHLLDLGPMNRSREPGLGLLQQRMDPNDLRKHQTFLTPTGRALMHRILGLVRSY